MALVVFVRAVCGNGGAVYVESSASLVAEAYAFVGNKAVHGESIYGSGKIAC